jgi:hypothetical protein
VTLAFATDEFEGQPTPHGLLGRDHLRTGKVRLGQDVGQPDVVQERYEKEAAPSQGQQERGARLKARTSAVAGIAGQVTAGRSSSRRRGKRAKPASRTRTARALRLLVWPAGARSCWMS